jgi:hypothetical protein
MKLDRLAPFAFGAALALGIAACDDEPTSSDTAAATATRTGDVERYCALTAELDALGEQIFADMPEEATAEDAMQREQQLVSQAAPQMEELVQVAPEEIAEDVSVLLDGLRARAATGEDPEQEAASAAEERILAFEEENCS